MDPSIIGRWQHTPTTVPVLDRLSVIEDAPTEVVEYSEVTAADLIPEPNEYRIGPGDRLLITLFDDIDARGVPNNYEREVDIRGNIDLPQLGQINLTGRTAEQARKLIVAALSRFVNDPLVSIVVAQQRQQTFTIMGEVQQPGPYFIAKPDYRLLEALTSGGRFPESIEEVYVIRQVPLNDAVRGILPMPAPGAEPAPSPSPTPPPTTTPKPPEKVIDLIDELTKPTDPAPEPKTPPPATPPVDPKAPSLAVFGGAAPSTPVRRKQPAGQPPANPSDPGRPPAVDLVNQPPTAAPTPGSATTNAPGGQPGWVFLNGQWVQARPTAGAETPGPNGETLTAEQLLTQRVIRVPMKPLLAGLPQYNIVVRPGDIVRVPSPSQGLVYIVGQVQRPGPYNLPEVGHLTILRAIDAAGGLSPIAIPERVDITRVVGKDRQATLRLDLRAIAQGTMPDIYLRMDDRINVGTNYFAYPLAVLRNGLRMSYGFGFVFDRNFADDVFTVNVN